MKTKMKMLSLLMIIALAFGVMSVKAETQDTIQSVCKGDQPYHVDPITGAVFTWTISGGGTIVSGTGTESIVVNWNLVGGPYRLGVYATVNGCAGPEQHMWVNVVASPVGPTLLARTPNSDTVCPGTLVSATFNAGSGGLNCADEYAYTIDGGTTWLAYTEGQTINTTGVTQVQIRGRRACDPTLGCGATEWTVLATWTVAATMPVSVTITGAPNPVCEGSEITFTSSVTNGGTATTYQWYVNGLPAEGGTAATFTYVPTNGDTVYVIVTSSEPCASNNPAQSNTVTVTVNPKPVTSGIWHN